MNCCVRFQKEYATIRLRSKPSVMRQGRITEGLERSLSTPFYNYG